MNRRLKPLPPHLHHEALRRLRLGAARPAPPAESDPFERACGMNAWLRAACLTDRGWRVVLRDERPVLKIGQRFIDLPEPAKADRRALRHPNLDRTMRPTGD